MKSDFKKDWIPLQARLLVLTKPKNSFLIKKQSIIFVFLKQSVQSKQWLTSCISFKKINISRPGKTIFQEN